MPHYNARNERVKKEYFRFLKETDRKSEATIDGIRKAILRFETYTRLKDFATFNKEQAVAFKKHLSGLKAERTGELLAKHTLLSTVNAIKDFLKWLSCQQGYRSRVKLTDIEYLNLSEKETRAAKEPRFKTFPTLEQIRAGIEAMPTETEVDLRNRALFAFTTLTGIRDSALVSLRLKHVILERSLVIQDPREVRTKRSKRIDTFFFPVGEDIEEIVIDWIRLLREEKLYGNDDPVFPRTRVGQDRNHSFAVQGLEPEFWRDTGPVRQIFRAAFEAAGLPYYNPHSFRDTLEQLGERVCPTIEHFKAWSQNLGHEHVNTTLTSYGSISPHRQGELIRSITLENFDSESITKNEEVMAHLRRIMQVMDRSPRAQSTKSST